MKILITGIAGFIGSTLAHRLLAESDWEIWGVDNNFRYDFSFLEQTKNPRLRLIKGDICDEDLIEHLCEECFDFVVHLAAIPGERLCRVYPEEAIRTNIFGTRVLLEALSKWRPSLFIFASSQVVYGVPHKLPIREFDLISPNNLYSFTKAADEMLLGIYKRKGIPITILRFSSVYGHGVFARWKEIIGRFVYLAHEQSFLTLYRPRNLSGGGEQAVDLVHVNDIVDGILIALQKREKTTGDIYNLSSGSATSVKDIALIVQRLAKELLGKDIGIEVRDIQEEEIPRWEISHEKFTGVTGWTPRITLQEGVKDMFAKYQWYKKTFGKIKEPVVRETPQQVLI